MVISANDQVLKPYVSGKLTANRSVLVMVGVKALTDSVSYSLLNYGPSAFTDSYLKTIDLSVQMKNNLYYS